MTPLSSSQPYRPYYEKSATPGRDFVLLLGFLAAFSIIYVFDATSDSVRWAAMGLVGVAALAWSVRTTRVDPRWLILALVLEELCPYISALPIDPEAGRWFIRIPLLLAFALPAVPLVWKNGVLKQPGFRLWMVYFGWAAISVVYSVAPTTSGGRLLGDAMVFVALSGAVSGIENEDDVQDALRRFLIGCAILQLLNLIAFVAFPKDLSWAEDQEGIMRFSGFSTTANVMGELMLATIGAGLVHWRVTRGWRRIVLALTMAASVVFAAMADSRSVFVALSVGCSAYLVWRYRVKGLAIILLLALAAGAVYASMNIINRSYLNRDLDTFTGRTMAWTFEIGKLEQHPLTGYGYDVEGAIFKDRYFPNWETFWDQGVNTALHDGYLSIAIGLGIPALILWLYVFLRPWIWLLRRDGYDPWRLKPIFFFVVLPALVLGIDETGVAEPRYVKGVLLFLCWMIAQRRYIAARAEVVLEVQSTKWSPFAVNARMVGMIAGAVILLGATRAFAASFYVDALHGSDSNSGASASAPWKTLNKVNHYPFSPGDVVHLSRGSTWRETLRPFGRDDANFSGVTFTSYGSGPAPIINGADLIFNWSPAGGSVYSAPVSKLVYNLYVDQGPGWGLPRACCMPGRECAPSPRKNPIRGATCALGPMRSGSWYWSGPAAPDGARPNTLYLWMPDGSAPSGHQVEAVTRKANILSWVTRNQLDNLTIDGLHLIQAGWRAISLESGDAAGCCGSRGIGNGRGISGLTVRNCIVERSGTGQFDDDNYGNAITIINASAPVVEGNRVSYAGNHGNCINVQNSNGARVLNNDVDHWFHNGIDIKGSHDVLVQGNYSHDQRELGAAFYSEFSRNVTFAHNRAHEVSNGFQISVGTTASILNNTIQAAGTGVFFGPRSYALTLHGNSMTSCVVAVAGDGSGTLQQDDNMWGTNPRFMVHGREVSLNAWGAGAMHQ